MASRAHSAAKFNRKRTGKSYWEEAKSLVAAWKAADSWADKKMVEPTSPAQEQPEPKRISIAEAVRVFLSHRDGAKIRRQRWANT